MHLSLLLKRSVSQVLQSTKPLQNDSKIPFLAPESSHLPVLIIGGGISGLTFAKSCEIAKIPYKVFEKSEKIQTDHISGTEISLWGPAERILNVLGLSDKLKAISQRISYTGYRTQSGKYLVQPPSISSESITTCLTLMKGDLIETLFKSLPNEKVILNHEFESYELNKDSGVVNVLFKNGKSYKGSLIVGADGINSKVRKNINPNVKPEYCGYSFYRGVMKLGKNEGFDGKYDWGLSNSLIAWESWGKGCKVAFVPLRPSQFFWFVSVDMPEAEVKQEVERIKNLSSNELNIELAKRFSDWHSPISDILKDTPASSIIFTPVNEIKLSSSQWISSENKIVLIGDACHAISQNLASGGMMNMQDAVQLASSLAPLYFETKDFSSPKLEPILQNYLEQRKNKVKTIQISNKLITKLAQPYSQLVTLRNGAISMIPTVILNKIVNYLHKFYLGSNYTVPNLNQGLYPRLFPNDLWEKEMPELIKKFHSHESTLSITHNCEGQVTMWNGSSFVSKIVAKIVSMPPGATNTRVTVRIKQFADGSELWTRYFRSNDNKKVSIFETKQYIENEDFVEVINVFNLNIVNIEVIMKMVANDGDVKGFKHVFKSVGLRLFPLIRGGVKFTIPKFMQPLASGDTLVDKSGKSWEFDVRINAQNNLFWRTVLMTNDLTIAGYKGRITKFDKYSITQYFNGKSQRNLSKVEGSYQKGSNVNVLILGGYGLFGNRIVSGLVISSIFKDLPCPTVFINARNEYLSLHKEIVDRIHSKLIVKDPFIQASDVSSLVQPDIFDAKDSKVLIKQLKNKKIDVVINCIGPFQNTKYEIPNVCAELGIDYLDLADARDYVINFSKELNASAQNFNTQTITGASTFPAVSSAACKSLILSSKLSKVSKIEISMSPGNKTPRGLATMQSILCQAGQPITWKINEKEYKKVGWQELSKSKIGEFHPKMKNPKRWLSAIDSPDLELIPEYISKILNNKDLPTVSFKAGLENSLMHLGLWSLSFLVRLGLVKDLSRFSNFFKKVSETKPFLDWVGSDTAGMFVKIEGESEERKKKIRVLWRLYAGSAEGVQIPATPAVIIVQKMIEARNNTENKKNEGKRVGAYPCLDFFTLEEFMEQLKGYDIEDDIFEEEI